MKMIGIFKAKTHLSEIVRAGQEICLTHRGKEIAVIVPFEKYKKDKVDEIFVKLECLKKRAPLGNANEIAEMKNQGRK